MRKVSVFSMLFLFAFGLSAGVVVGFADNAQAETPTCVFDCKVSLYCSTGPHPSCYNPRYPSAVFLVSDCVGGPLYCPAVFELIGCWSGSGKCMPIPIP